MCITIWRSGCDLRLRGDDCCWKSTHRPCRQHCQPFRRHPGSWTGALTSPVPHSPPLAVPWAPWVYVRPHRPPLAGPWAPWIYRGPRWRHLALPLVPWAHGDSTYNPSLCPKLRGFMGTSQTTPRCVLGSISSWGYPAHLPSLCPESDWGVHGLHEFAEESDDSPVEASRTLHIAALPLLAYDVGDRVTWPRPCRWYRCRTRLQP